MDNIVAGHRQLMVQQQKEWGEILIDFETRNRYALLDASGIQIGYAAEESGGFAATIGRQFLGKMRKLTLHIMDKDGHEVGRGEKPFRWFFHELEMFDGGKNIGSIRRRFAILNRLFTVSDASGRELFTIKSPLFKIWTFKVLKDDREVSVIRKKFSGLLKEAFTDADNFGIEFSDENMNTDSRKLLLGATFLIDFCCFENNNG